jgi:hypothetical protein
MHCPIVFPEVIPAVKLWGVLRIDYPTIFSEKYFKASFSFVSSSKTIFLAATIDLFQLQID